MLASLEILEACHEIVVEKAFVYDLERNTEMYKCDSLGIKESTLQRSKLSEGPQFYLKILSGS